MLAFSQKIEPEVNLIKNVYLVIKDMNILQLIYVRMSTYRWRGAVTR